jgi:hypothetical protein
MQCAVLHQLPQAVVRRARCCALGGQGGGGQALGGGQGRERGLEHVLGGQRMVGRPTPSLLPGSTPDQEDVAGRGAAAAGGGLAS